MKVSELMENGSTWDEGKMGVLFGTFIRNSILNTPIGESGSRDELRWYFDEKGVFSVKSAYLLAIGFYDQDPNTSEPDRKIWSRLVWNVSIPPKARVFLWRDFKNIIPTSANLKRHHVPTEGICLLCGDRWGSIEHSVLYCLKVAGVWKASRFWEVVKQAEGMVLIDVAAAIFKEWGDVEYEL